MRDNIALADP
ncbi:hypothetical protein MKD33_02520, partial [Chromobacterium piscinae]